MKVFQNKKDDCYAAVIASMLGLQISEVPNFASNDKHACKEAEKWFKARGYYIVELSIDSSDHELPACFSEVYRTIGILKKSHLNYSHAVILEHRKNEAGYIASTIEHDPLKDSSYTIEDLVAIQYLSAVPAEKENSSTAPKDKWDLFEEILDYITYELVQDPANHLLTIISAMGAWDNLEDIKEYSGLPKLNKEQ